MSGYEKNFDSWNRNDIANGEELTVTITLAEYRELIGAKAKGDKELNEKNTRIYNLEGQVRKLTEKIANMVTETERVTEE